MNIKSLISLLRPAQWVKNGFVFLPMFFGGYLGEWAVWREALVCFMCFSLMASAIYCLNDIRDVEADRRHPRKCRRPIASGAVSEAAARVVMSALIVLSLAGTLLLRQGAWATAGILVGYLVLNVAYCLRLKHFGIIDVSCVAAGFVLRLFAGGACEGITLSPWIVLMTFLIALFLAFAKRRDDVIAFEREGRLARRSIRHYNLQYMDVTMCVVASVTMVCYIMYTVSPEVTARLRCGFVYVSAVFVLMGMLRYLQLAIVSESSGSPTSVLLRDRFIQICLACWAIFFLIVIYL